MLPLDMVENEKTKEEGSIIPMPSFSRDMFVPTALVHIPLLPSLVPVSRRTPRRPGILKCKLSPNGIY